MTPLPCPFCGATVELIAERFVRHTPVLGCPLDARTFPASRWNARPQEADTVTVDAADWVAVVKRLALTDERNEKLRTLAGFFASVIKSGEPWTSTCEQMYDDALLPPAKQAIG